MHQMVLDMSSWQQQHMQHSDSACTWLCAILCACPQEQQQAAAASEAEAYSGPRDVILVTDADSPTGELVTLQLILLRLVQCSGLTAQQQTGQHTDSVLCQQTPSPIVLQLWLRQPAASASRWQRRSRQFWDYRAWAAVGRTIWLTALGTAC
jgi:hypothetical protein